MSIVKGGGLSMMLSYLYPFYTLWVIAFRHIVDYTSTQETSLLIETHGFLIFFFR